MRRRQPEPGLAWPYRVALFLLVVAAMTFAVLAISSDDPPCPDGQIEIGSYKDRWGAEHRSCGREGADGFIDIDP